MAPDCGNDVTIWASDPQSKVQDQSQRNGAVNDGYGYVIL